MTARTPTLLLLSSSFWEEGGKLGVGGANGIKPVRKRVVSWVGYLRVRVPVGF